jgi:N6-adenosine-specific RNA methylase IME4
MPTTIDSEPRALAVLDGIRRVLAETTDLAQIKDFRDQAEAVRHYAKSAALGLEMQNKAAEAKLVAERRAGEVLEEMRLRGGDRKSGHRKRGTVLDNLGISKVESTRWQREASVPEEEFQQYLHRTREEAKELTSRGLLRLAHVHARETGSARENLFSGLAIGLQKLAKRQSQFGCIHVIPPWPEGRTSRANICRLVRELVDLPVGPVAAKMAHLHLWTPPEQMLDAVKILLAWGFQYRASLVRTRPPADRGSYWRQAHDVLLLGVRGELGFPDSSLLSWMDPHTRSATDSLHEIRSLIEQASPSPYLELFGGKATRGWTVLLP